MSACFAACFGAMRTISLDCPDGLLVVLREKNMTSHPKRIIAKRDVYLDPKRKFDSRGLIVDSVPKVAVAERRLEFLAAQLDEKENRLRFVIAILNCIFFTCIFFSCLPRREGAVRLSRPVEQNFLVEKPPADIHNSPLQSASSSPVVPSTSSTSSSPAIPSRKKRRKRIDVYGGSVTFAGYPWLKGVSYVDLLRYRFGHIADVRNLAIPSSGVHTHVLCGIESADVIISEFYLNEGHPLLLDAFYSLTHRKLTSTRYNSGNYIYPQEEGNLKMRNGAASVNGSSEVLVEDPPGTPKDDRLRWFPSVMALKPEEILLLGAKERRKKEEKIGYNEYDTLHASSPTGTIVLDAFSWLVSQGLAQDGKPQGGMRRCFLKRSGAESHRRLQLPFVYLTLPCMEWWIQKFPYTAENLFQIPEAWRGKREPKISDECWQIAGCESRDETCFVSPGCGNLSLTDCPDTFKFGQNLSSIIAMCTRKFPLQMQHGNAAYHKMLFDLLEPVVARQLEESDRAYFRGEKKARSNRTTVVQEKSTDPLCMTSWAKQWGVKSAEQKNLRISSDSSEDRKGSGSSTGLNAAFVSKTDSGFEFGVAHPKMPAFKKSFHSRVNGSELVLTCPGSEPGPAINGSSTSINNLYGGALLGYITYANPKEGGKILLNREHLVSTHKYFNVPNARVKNYFSKQLSLPIHIQVVDLPPGNIVQITDLVCQPKGSRDVDKINEILNDWSRSIY